MQKKRIENKKLTDEQISEQKQTLHWMQVCIHGVPHGYKCDSCKKVIQIPEDAKIKPEKEEGKDA